MLRDETACADNIEGCNAEETLGVVCAFRLENFGADGHGAVDGVGDDQYVSVWSSVCDGFGEVPYDGGVGIEEVWEKSLLEGVLNSWERYRWKFKGV